jgi:acyl phosphate:glycerol-3-phosphate acyltransferase
VNAHSLIPLIAYLLGSMPFGYLIVKARGARDIRESGSGNTGAANVARTAGPVAGLLTLLLDTAKGFLAVWIAAKWTGGDIRWMMAAAVFAVIGHIFPVWLEFRGGKGVATGLGVFLPICPQAVGAAAVLWLVFAFSWRYSSLASIAAAAALPVLIHLLYAPRHAPPLYVTLGTVLISVLVLAKHRANIQRLIDGTENRLRIP